MHINIPVEKYLSTRGFSINHANPTIKLIYSQHGLAVFDSFLLGFVMLLFHSLIVFVND